MTVAFVSMLAAIAVGHLVASWIDPPASPFVAVNNWVRDLSPHPVTEWAKATFGTYDKLVLFTGVAAVLLGITALAGLISRRRATPGLVLTAVLGVVGFVAVLTRPDVGQLGIVAPAASMIVGFVAFRWLHARAPFDTHTERRTFLRGVVGTVIGAGVAGVVGQLVAGRVDVEASRRQVGKLVPTDPAPKLPANADFPGTARFITSNRDFYRIDTALSLPRVAAQDWRLRIHGLVDREVEYTYDDIRDRGLIERPVTMACVSNDVGGGLISTANFMGVPLRDLLRQAGIRSGADQVFSTSADGFTAGSPVDVLLEESRGAMLAIGMNGEPLPIEHGFPARLVVPGLYGYVSATKWVVDLEVTTFAAKQGYWMPRGWSALGPIKTQSRIDTPHDGDTVGRRTTVAGIAWAQTVGVDRVDVMVDGGEWQPAELAAEVSLNTWRMWQITLDLDPGDHTIQVRATDRDGYTQTSNPAPPAPDGATGWHRVDVTAA